MERRPNARSWALILSGTLARQHQIGVIHVKQVIRSRKDADSSINCSAVHNGDPATPSAPDIAAATTCHSRSSGNRSCRRCHRGCVKFLLRGVVVTQGAIQHGADQRPGAGTDESPIVADGWNCGDGGCGVVTCRGDQRVWRNGGRAARSSAQLSNDGTCRDDFRCGFAAAVRWIEIFHRTIVALPSPTSCVWVAFVYSLTGRPPRW